MMWLNVWKKDVKELETRVRGLKARLRRNWNLYSDEIVERTIGKRTYKERKEAPGYDQWRLMQLKHQLTILYEYRANKRGKFHGNTLKKSTALKGPDLSRYDIQPTWGNW